MRLTPSRLTITLFALYLAVCAIWSAQAESPAPLNEVAPVADIDHEIRLQIEKIGELLASPEAFGESKDTEVTQSFGVLACLGQALAEHPEAGDAAMAGARLRNAALMFSAESDYEQTQAALAACVAAVEGASTEEAQIEHPWNELTPMYPMMEEVNARNAVIARSLRRPRGDADSISNASTLAILALAMEADTHHVEGDEAQIALWKELSAEYRREMTAVADALRNNDAAAVREHFTAANAACDRCHVEIRDVE